MPVQSRTIPYILKNRDLMVQSRTGSGKTGAYILPLLEKIDVRKNSTQVLVLVPTRELARQVQAEAEMLGSVVGLRSTAIYGGVRFRPQLKALERGAHFVVGTPGRLLDHLLKGTMHLRDLETLIFDEADRMLSMGFYPDMKELKKYLPRHPYSAYMFSATYPSHVIRLSAEFMRQPDMLSLSRDRVHVAETEHIFYVAPAMDKDRALIKIIEMENPSSAIVFCNRRDQVHYVTVVLQRFGYDADELTSDLSQTARDRVMARIKTGSLHFLVATDLAARGIDISELSHVIQYEVPEDIEGYIHRSGRTGRAGAAGVAISLVSGNEQLQLRKIARVYEIDIQERTLPTEAEVATLVAQRTTAMLEARLRKLDNVHRERMQRFVTLAQELGQAEDEMPILAMLLDEYYQQTFHTPPEMPATGAEMAVERPAPEKRGRRGRGVRRKPPRR